jgi:hypothetical protein
MGGTTRSLGELHKMFTPSFRSVYKEEHMNYQQGVGLGWVAAASGSLIGPLGVHPPNLSLKLVGRATRGPLYC